MQRKTNGERRTERSHDQKGVWKAELERARSCSPSKLPRAEFCDEALVVRLECRDVLACVRLAVQVMLVELQNPSQHLLVEGRGLRMRTPWPAQSNSKTSAVSFKFLASCLVVFVAIVLM